MEPEMKQPPLIALYSSGNGHGKSTVANHLVDTYGFHLVKFASPMRRMTAVLLQEMGINDPSMYLEGPRKQASLPGYEDRRLTPRYLMQTLGTEWGRDLIHEDFWVDIAMFKASRVRAKGQPVVIDDLRFLNEYREVMLAGGAVLRVHRPGLDDDHTGHASENQLNKFPFDALLWNDRGIDQLLEQVDRLLED